MIALRFSEPLIRAAALYLPITITAVLAVYRRPGLARMAGAVLATSWNLAGLLALNVVALRCGWWTFETGSANVAGVPADLWVGWSLLWGAVPILCGVRRVVPVVIALIAADLVLMPLGEPVVRLGGLWLIGEAVALTTCLLPGMMVGRWTESDTHLGARVVMQVLNFVGLFYFMLPCLIFTVTGEGWGELLGRARWQIVLVAVLAAPVAAMAIQAVREFAIHGGTPVPLDPPKRLVTTGPYAYVANPMQLSGTILLAMWAALLGSVTVLLAAVMGCAFSAGFAAWNEDSDLRSRFGEDWQRYRRDVPLWVPRWRPAVSSPAVIYVAQSCVPCSEIGRFLKHRPTVGLDVCCAEERSEEIRRVTYLQHERPSTGLAAICRSLEHINLGWAIAGWVGRIPGIQQVLQLVADTVGGGPRSVPQRGIS